MNQVTQQNAANSEESASAAEELSSQAEEMRGLVAGFQLTNGNGSLKRLSTRATAETPPASLLQQKKLGTLAGMEPVRNGSGGNGGDGGGHAPLKTPEEAIPFDGMEVQPGYDDKKVLRDF